MVVGLYLSPINCNDIFSHIFVVQIAMFAWEDENKQKSGRGLPIFENNVY